MTTYYDRTNIEEILKQEYSDLIKVVFTEQNLLLSIATSGKKGTIRGKSLSIPFERSRNPVGGAGGPESAYGQSGVSSWDNYTIGTAWYRGRAKISLEAQDDSKDGRLAFLNALERALSDTSRGVRNAVSRDMYGTRDGVLAALSGTGAVDGSYWDLAVRNAWNASVNDQHGTRYLMPEMWVNIARVGVGLLKDAAGNIRWKVRAVNSLTGVKIEAASGAVLFGGGGGSTLQADDYLVVDGAWDSTGVFGVVGNDQGFALYGLDELIDDGTTVRAGLQTTYGGLTGGRSAFPDLNAAVIDGNGTVLTEEMIDNMFGQILLRSGQQPSPGDYTMLCHPSVITQFRRAVYGQINYAPKQAPMGIDNKMLSVNPGYGDFTFTGDLQCPPRTLFAVCRPELEYYEDIPISFDESDGGIIKMYRGTAGNEVYDIHEAFLRTRLQMFTAAPQRMGKIVDLDVTNTEFGGSGIFPAP